MTRGARGTSLVAMFAIACAGVVGLDVECRGAETARAAQVIAIGPASAPAQPAVRDCTAGLAAHGAALALLRYRDGSRYERRWHMARVAAIDGLRVGDRVRFDPASCSMSSFND